jgi:hypothetical protein
VSTRTGFILLFILSICGLSLSFLPPLPSHFPTLPFSTGTCLLTTGSVQFSGAGRGIGILADDPTNIIGRMPMPLSDMKLNAERLGRYDDGR